MIVARLQGGLGNQLFQFAAARSLAAKLDCAVKFDIITSLQKDRLRKIALDELEADLNLASEKEIRKFITFPGLYRHSPGFFAQLGRNIYREPHFHFDPNFFKQSDPVFLDGFWQSPLYFEEIANQIRSSFKVRKALVENIAGKAEEIGSCESISMHIRRGDLLSSKAAAYHGILPASYYEKALALLLKELVSPKLYVFSDDINWVRKNLELPTGTDFVSSYTNTSIEDFQLMTQCRHNIIANSSFSWWPAWLNSNPNKKVIAPQQWFANKKIDTKDLIPPGWIRI